ncbi:unnamed protein product, partial [Closterium sp. NIES-53]
LNGDVLHSIIGLPSTLRVAKAHVAKLEIKLPALSLVNKEPTVVAISTLDLVLRETAPHEAPLSSPGALATKSTSYGFADKIADGMTLEVGVVNLMIETRGGRDVSGHDAATWIPPIASITIRGLRLCTTNERWQVVNLADTRTFFAALKCIYIFRLLEWESLSIDLIPHPDMFHASLEVNSSKEGQERDGDGAKRAFFGGERFVDDIRGRAYVTMHRTELNNPLGLEVDMQLSEANVPALTEPGLRALMRFMTGMYACLLRSDLTDMSQVGPETAGRVLISLTLERLFIRIQEEDYQLELILQSLKYVQGSASEPDSATVANMVRLYLGQLFLKDTYSDPPVALLQPVQEHASSDVERVPSFASEHVWPRIYPVDTDDDCLPPPSMFRLFSAFSLPPAPPPAVASQLVIRCDPLQISLQEESCFRIASLVADGLMVQQADSTPPVPALRYLLFMLDGLHLSLSVPPAAFAPPSPSDAAAPANPDSPSQAGEGGAGATGGAGEEARFTGARVQVGGFSAMLDSFMPFDLLDVERDAACFALWPGQPVDAGQMRLAVWADLLSVSLDVGDSQGGEDSSTGCGRGSARGGGGGDDDDAWASSPVSFEGQSRLAAAASQQLQCVCIKDPRLEMALLSHDGKPIARMPPPGGTFRLGVASQEVTCNTSRLQLLFVLRMADYLTRVSRALVKVGKGNQRVTDPSKGLSALVDAASATTPTAAASQPAMNSSSSGGGSGAGGGTVSALSELAALAPGDSAVSLAVDALNLRMLESGHTGDGSTGDEGAVLSQLVGRGMSMKVTHQSLGGAAATSSTIRWQSIRVECVETEETADGAAAAAASGPQSPGSSAGPPRLRAVLWSGDGDSDMDALARTGTMSAPDPSSAAGFALTRSPSASASALPFLHLSVLHVLPYDSNDASSHSLTVEAKVGGVRLSGGWSYNEALLRRFGVLDSTTGGPGAHIVHLLDVLQHSEALHFLLASSTDEPALAADPAAAAVAWEVALPQEMDVDVQLLDWLFALEGAHKAFVALPSTTAHAVQRREDLSWHSTFRMFRVSAHSNPLNDAHRRTGTTHRPPPAPGSSPVGNILIRVEGIQAFKPRIFDASEASACSPSVRPSAVSVSASDSSLELSTHPASPSSRPISRSASDAPLPHHTSLGAPAAPGAAAAAAGGPLGSSARSGLDLELRLASMPTAPEAASASSPGAGSSGAAGGAGSEAGEAWVVRSVQMAVQEPVTVEASKEDLQHLLGVCKMELSAASRIAVGGLMLLRERGSSIVTQATIDQLVHFGKRLVSGDESLASLAQAVQEAATDNLTADAAAHVAAREQQVLQATSRMHSLAAQLKTQLDAAERGGEELRGMRGDVESLLAEIETVKKMLGQAGGKGTPQSRPAATTVAAAARATAGGGAAGSAGSAAGARGAGGVAGSAGGAAGAGGATGSAGGAAGAGGGGGFGFLRTAQRRQQSQHETFSSQVLSELFPQRRVTGSVEAAALGANESTAALGASESAAALGASESAAALGARASPATVVARASTILSCPPVPSGSLSDLHLPTFSTNLVRNATIQDVWIDTFIPGGQCVAICMCSRTGRHLATFTRRTASSLYTLITASAQVAEAGQVAAPSQVSAFGQLAESCSCRVLSHQTLLWHHRLGHPSLPRLRGMHSCLLVSGLPRSLPSLPRSTAPPCLPYVEGRQRAAPHSSEFLPTTAPLKTLHMDVWGLAPIGGTDQERYFLLVVYDYTRYTTVFPLRRKADVSNVLIPWIRATRCQLCKRFSRDFPVLCLPSDRGGEFCSDLLAEFCRDEGIRQSFTLPTSPQQNGIAEHRLGLIMELNLWPRVSEPETSPIVWWTGKVGDASVFRVWGALSLVRDAKANKLSSRTLHCVSLAFPTDAPEWQFYHPRSRRNFSSQDVTFDESVCYYRLHPHTSHPVPLAPLFLVPVPPPGDPLPPQGPAPSGVSQVDPPPLVEPLEISFDSSGLSEGGDPATDDTAATRRSPRLETPPGFPPQLSLPPPQPAAVDFGAETAGTEPGGAEIEGEGFGGAATGGAGSWGAATGGDDSGGTASPSGGGAVGDPAGGPGAGQPPLPDLLETLSPQAIRAWIVQQGSPGGGGYKLADGGATSPRDTAGAGGTGGTAGGAGGAGGAAGARGAEATSPRGTASAGGAGGAAGAGGAGAGGTGGAGAAGTGGAGAAGPRGARTRSAGAARAGGAAGAGGVGGATGNRGAGGNTGARGPGTARASGAAGAEGAGGAAGGAGAGGACAAGAGGAGAAGTALRRPFFYPQPQSTLLPPDSVLRQVLSLPSSIGLPLPFLYPPTDQSQPQLLPSSPLPALAPYTEVTESLTEHREPETCASTPFRAHRVAHPHPPAVPGTHSMALRPSSVPHRVVVPEPPASSLPHVPDSESDLARVASPTVTHLLATDVTDPDLESTTPFSLFTELVDFAARSRLDYVASLVSESESDYPPSVGGELAIGSDVLEDSQFGLECLATALPRFASMLLCPKGDPDALDIPTPRSYAEAIAGEYSSLWQTAMDTEMAFWNSTGTYIDVVPTPRGVDFFQTFSPTPKMTTLRALLHVAAQRDYELHSLDFSTAFLQGNLHEEIRLRCPPGFTGSFPAGTQSSLRWPVYGLRQAPREWHDTLRTTLAALGFAPSSADPSLFLRIDTTLLSFYVLVYVDDLVFATTDTEAQALVKAELQERNTCTDLGELRSYLGLQITQDRARHTITLTQSHMVHQVLQCFGFQFSSPQPTPLSTGHSAPPSDESVERSGPYPELAGCLMYLMTCTRPDLAYPLSLPARYVAPGRHRKVHWDAAKRVMRYLCSTSGMGLVLGGQGSVVLTGHSDASWADDQATQHSSQGYTFSLGSGSVSWRSTRSSSVLGSSCEAEIYTGAMAARELHRLTYHAD